MKSFGDRLKEERERLDFSQEAFGAIGGVKRLAQANYEKGERSPDIDYLAALSKIGVDVQYIVNGVRSSAALANDEEVLLQGYRQMDPQTKQRMLAFVATGSTEKVSVKGGVGQQFNESIARGTFTVNMKKKGK